MHNALRRIISNCRTEMPKRKADQSVDEWLSEGAAATEGRRTVAEANCSQENIQALPTAYRPPVDQAINPGTKASTPMTSPIYVAPPESEVVAATLRPVQAEVAVEAGYPAVQGPTSEGEATE